MQFLLEISSDVKSPHELYAHAMAHFHLYLLNRQLALVTAATATPLMLNATMQMLQVAASQASELSHHGQPLPHFEAAVEAAKKRLDNVALIRASAAARKFELPSGDGGGSTTKESVLKLSYSSPSGIIPPVATTSATVSGLNEAIERSSRNTGSLAVPPTPTFENLGCCLKDLLHFLEHHTVGTKDAGGLVAQHVLCSIEAVLFPAAASGFASSAALSEDDVERLLVKIVEIYRTSKLEIRKLFIIACFRIFFSVKLQTLSYECLKLLSRFFFFCSFARLYGNQRIFCAHASKTV